jgi:hypothetical protein
MITPCKDCSDRFLGCHSKCNKYGEWKQSEQKIKELKVAEKRKNEIFYGSVAMKDNIKSYYRT